MFQSMYMCVCVKIVLHVWIQLAATYLKRLPTQPVLFLQCMTENMFYDFNLIYKPVLFCCCIKSQPD